MGPAGVDLSLGCICIGVLLNVWLYGFSCVQVYIYFLRFKADKTWLRSFVAILFVLDTLNTVLDCHFLYDYLISHFGMTEYSASANSTFASDPFLVSLIGLSTQLFFAWRVYRLTPGRWAWFVPTIIALTGLSSFVGATWTTVMVVKVRIFAEFQSFQAAVSLWLAGAAVADSIVTIALMLTLKRSKTGFSQTDDVITKLIRGTLQTGLLTASFAFIDLVLFLASDSTLHLIFNLPLSKLYLNSLFATLNARAFINNTGSARYLSSDSHGMSQKKSSAGKKSGRNSHYYLRQAEDGQVPRGLQTKESFNTADERRSSEPTTQVSSDHTQTYLAKDSRTSAVNKVKTTKNFFGGKMGIGAFRSQRNDEIEMPQHRFKDHHAGSNGIQVVTIHDRFEEDDPYVSPPASAGIIEPTKSRAIMAPDRPSSASVDSTTGKAVHQEDDEEFVLQPLPQSSSGAALGGSRNSAVIVPQSSSSFGADESMPVYHSGIDALSPARRLDMAIEQGNKPPHPYTTGF